MAFRSVSFFLLLFRLFSVLETFSVFTLDYTHNIARSVQISPARVRKEVGHYIHPPSHLDPALSLGSIISSWNGPLARKCRSSSGAKELGYWLHKETGVGEEMRELHLFFLTESRYCHRHLTRTSAASNRRKAFLLLFPPHSSQNRLVEKQISIRSQMQGVPDGVTNLDWAWRVGWGERGSWD
jgi:hypothetical protein